MGTLSLPLENYRVLHSHDVDDVCEQVSRAYCSHRLTPKSASYPLDTRYHRVSFGDVSFNYLHYGADVSVVPGSFEGFLMIEIPLAGFARIHYGDQMVDSCLGVGSVVSSTRPVRSRWSADARRLMVQVHRESLERFATNFLGHRLTQPIEFQLTMNLESGIGQGLSSYVGYVVDQLSNNTMFHEYAMVRRQVSRTIFTMLLSGQSHNYSEEIRAVATPGAPKHIERTYQFIMENYDQDIGIQQLTEISGVSMRALYAGFKRYKGISPMLALKNRRLEAAHEDLFTGMTGEGVTEIALEWGFTHLGNFAKDYQRRFGEKPSETLRSALGKQLQ